jgi:hypothetical protein
MQEMAKEAANPRREDAQKAADDRRRCKLKMLTRSTQRQCELPYRGDLEQGDHDQNRADQGDLEHGNLEQAITMIHVKGGALVAARDVPRAPAAAFLSAVRANRRRPIKRKNMFQYTQLFRFMKKWAVMDV